MPNPLAAHRSNAHRLACLSLYRALLTHSLALSATHPGSLSSLIRHRFKTDRLLQSPSRIANGLNAGNEALKLLCASAHGETKSIKRLSSLLESTLKLSESNQAYRTALQSTGAPRSVRPTSSGKGIRSGTDTTSQSRRSASRPVLERPLPLSELKSGKRRVPKFMAVQGIPFLLYSKPQSSSLGGLLRQKIAWQDKRWKERAKLNEETIPLGESEDVWDALVALQTGQEGLVNNSSVPEDDGHGINLGSQSWNSAFRFMELSIAQKIRDFDRRNLETGRRMVEIMQQERLLAAKEKADAVSKKYEKRVSRMTDQYLDDVAADQGSKDDGQRQVKEE